MLPVPEKQEPVRPRQHLPLTAALLGCGALLLVSMILGVAIGSVPLSPATGSRPMPTSGLTRAGGPSGTA